MLYIAPNEMLQNVSYLILPPLKLNPGSSIVTKDVYDIDLTTVIFDVNLVGSNHREWWIDIGVTCHVCSDKKMFSAFEPTEIRERRIWETLPPLKLRVKKKWS